MKRSARMEKIADINLGFENIAGAAFATARRQLQAQEKQLEQLNIYKQEYQQKLKARLSGNITVTEMQDYQYFFTSLDQAISQQTAILKQSENQVQHSKDEWMNKKQDVAKVSKVAERLKKKEDEESIKKEQQETDELNLRLYNKKESLIEKH